MIYTFLLGILLCYVYEKFGSMKAPIMLHVVLNLGSLIFTDIGVFNWLAREPFNGSGSDYQHIYLCSLFCVDSEKRGSGEYSENRRIVKKYKKINCINKNTILNCAR